jgi:hypothetical protein
MPPFTVFDEDELENREAGGFWPSDARWPERSVAEAEGMNNGLWIRRGKSMSSEL